MCETIKRVAARPVICYDNDTNQAGFELVKRVQQAMPVEACTTPLHGGDKSDLDSYICDFEQDHVAAWEGVKGPHCRSPALRPHVCRHGGRVF